MRAVVQRVKEAHVDVGGEVVGRIGQGLVVLLGVGLEDDESAAGSLARKILRMRLFDDDRGRMHYSVDEIGGGVLVVSQFTLWADTSGGRRPSFTRAAPGEVAEPLYRAFIDEMMRAGVEVGEGRFGADMDVHLVGRGPVTLIVE